MLNKYMMMTTMMMSVMFSLMMMLITMKMNKIMVEWNMMKMLSTNLSMMIMVDVKSTAFSSCVLLITSAIIMYTKYYMMESKKKNIFIKLIFMFILSMIILIHSPNLVTVILGWEGLGMTSFVLIMFYQNKKSMNSSFFTMMMNRLGDIMLILAMAQMMNMNSWFFESMMFNTSKNIMMTMIMVAAFSKSAQIPFSSWLTEAMAAPTPISALVHSSTLVTAGVLIFIRFEMMLKYSTMNNVIMIVSLMTLMMASMNSLTEWDIKKVVALSTLSQLSMMFITISMNLINLAMFHMLVHATFKALIFLCASSLISSSNTQDIRMMNSLSKKMFVTKMMFNLANLTLCGFPFMSSFYSKEMIMEMMTIKKMNWMMILIFYLCMMSTLFYALKMIFFLNIKKNMSKMMPQAELAEQKVSSIMLMMPSIMYGNKMNWILNTNFKIPQVTMYTKMVPIIMMLFMMSMIMKLFKFNKMLNFKKNMFNNYMWFMKNMSIQIKKEFFMNSMKMMKNSEKISMNKMINMMTMSMKNMSKKNFKLTMQNPKMMNLMIIMVTVMIL